MFTIRIVPDSVDFIAQNSFHTAHLASQIVQFLLHTVIVVQGDSQQNDYKGQCFGSDFIFAHDISLMALSLWPYLYSIIRRKQCQIFNPSFCTGYLKAHLKAIIVVTIRFPDIKK